MSGCFYLSALCAAAFLLEGWCPSPAGSLWWRTCSTPYGSVNDECAHRGHCSTKGQQHAIDQSDSATGLPLPPAGHADKLWKLNLVQVFIFLKIQLQGTLYILNSVCLFMECKWGQDLLVINHRTTVFVHFFRTHTDLRPAYALFISDSRRWCDKEEIQYKGRDVTSD